MALRITCNNGFGPKTHVQNTEYVDNDIDDDEEGADAYFFGQTQRCLLLTNGWIIRRVQCRGQACLLHAECYENRVEDKPF